jgi:hypothetical protein
MDPSSIIILSLIVSAFLLFAAVLAFGDYATVQARREREQASQKEAKAEEGKSTPVRKAA